jgi:hypothetical protein
MKLRKFLAVSFLLSAVSLMCACANLSDRQNAALKAAAKVALSFGLAELTDRVKEVRPYRDKLNALFEATFSKASAPESLGEQLRAGVSAIVPEALRPVVLAKLKASLQDKTVAGPASAEAQFNAQIASRL